MPSILFFFVQSSRPSHEFSLARIFTRENTYTFIETTNSNRSRSIVNFVERTSREKKMIAARPTTLVLLRQSSSTISRPSLNSPVTHDRLFAIKSNNRARKKKHVKIFQIKSRKSIAVIDVRCYKKLRLCKRSRVCRSFEFFRVTNIETEGR